MFGVSDWHFLCYRELGNTGFSASLFEKKKNPYSKELRLTVSNSTQVFLTRQVQRVDISTFRQCVTHV